MKTKVVLIIILGFISSFAFSQAEKASFFSKKHQHSISFEPIAISYDYTYKFSNYFGVGVRAETGFGLRAHISPVYYLRYMGVIDFACIQVQYRFLFPDNFHIDIGPYLTFGTMDSFNEIIGISYGLGISSFYHYKKLQLGFRLQVVFFKNTHDEFDVNGNHISSEKVTDYALLISPFVIGIAF